MRGTMRGRPTVARSVAGALVLLATVLLPATAWARPWYWHYRRAQELLLSGEAAAAEHELREALARRPEPACRVRTYGVRYRDYLPHYYLGVVLEQQGRPEEARHAFERSLEAGVLESCAATRSLAEDARERLARRARAEAPAAAPEGAPADVRAELAALRVEAVSAGAAALAAAELERADAAAARARGGDRAAWGEARAGYVAALSRARAEGPIVALLRREAEEAVEHARQEEGRADRATPESAARVAEARSALAEAERLLVTSQGPAASLRAARLADRADQLFAETRRTALGAARERRQRLRAELDLALALARGSRAALRPEHLPHPDVARSDRLLEQANRVARADASEAALRMATADVQRARTLLADVLQRPAPARPTGGPDARVLLPLEWSRGLAAPRAHLRPRTGERGAEAAP